MIGDIIGSTIAAGVNAAVQGGPRRQFKWNKRAAEHANQMNRANQQWLLGQEERLRDEARAYDSPKAQMQRYLEAGLNPNMIYGSGSSAGQAFPIHAGNLPGVNVEAPRAGLPDIAGSFIGAMRGITDIGLAQARTGQVEQETALKSVMTDIAKSNPMLNPAVAQWVANSMQETARLKTMEARVWLSPESPQYAKIAAKVNAQLDALMQKVGLNTADLAIRNKILESKEFENAVKEVQAKWLKDSEITPEHIRQALMVVLSKMIPGAR